MDTTIKAGIIGGAGYTGGELLRLLVRHPQVSVSFVHSRSNAGKPLHSVHQDLLGETDLLFTSEAFWEDPGSLDLIFACMGHGETKKFLAETQVNESIRIIDLSQDFRLAANARFGGRSFVYGLPELDREGIRNALNVANPGCFATAIQLGLLPLAQAGLLDEVYTTGITGSTGAGQSLSASSHFSWRANNIQAYKTLTHQHLKEIHQSLGRLQPGFPSDFLEDGEGRINFVPWRGDFTRGIFISSTLSCDWGLGQVQELYRDYYAGHPFTFVSEQEIFLKQVVNTNKSVIHLEKVGNKIVVHSVIDNLLKGASGQAVQNMNLMFGLEETAGLGLKAAGF